MGGKQKRLKPPTVKNVWLNFTSVFSTLRRMPVKKTVPVRKVLVWSVLKLNYKICSRWKRRTAKRGSSGRTGIVTGKAITFWLGSWKMLYIQVIFAHNCVIKIESSNHHQNLATNKDYIRIKKLLWNYNKCNDSFSQLR